jgi:hypothetical protein
MASSSSFSMRDTTFLKVDVHRSGGGGRETPNALHVAIDRSIEVMLGRNRGDGHKIFDWQHGTADQRPADDDASPTEPSWSPVCPAAGCRPEKVSGEARRRRRATKAILIAAALSLVLLCSSKCTFVVSARPLTQQFWDRLLRRRKARQQSASNNDNKRGPYVLRSCQKMESFIAIAPPIAHRTNN